MIKNSYGLHALVIFLSAFLLFVVEPVAAKHLLPYFGGGSSVWAVSLLFFTGVLYLGYLYVLFLTRLPKKRQVVVHVSIISLVSCVALLALVAWHSIYPPLEWTLGTDWPVFTVLVALIVSIGAPFFLLSTTSPLIQYWWGVSSQKEPYRLYALSNAGSLLALASYPFVIEPIMAQQSAEGLWLAVFFLYTLMYALLAKHFPSANFERKDIRADAGEKGASTSQKWAWIALAALPSALLVGVTSQITDVIAPVPLLWVVPLATYLVTLIIAFEGYGTSGFMALALLVLGVMYFEPPAFLQNIFFQVLSYLALLFFAGLVCHAKLYALRPKTVALPLYYHFVSLGGMLGVFCMSIIAPLLFNDFWEFPIVIALAAALAALMIPKKWFFRFKPRYVWAAKVILIFFIAGIFANFVKEDRLDPLGRGYTLISSTRNFYGVAKVQSEEGTTRTLVHGRTVHGMQFESPDRKLLPTLYYTPTSGVGRALMYAQKSHSDHLRIGVLGLGTATIASYCRPNDAYVFYEIDPRIVDIAKTQFSYLASCKGAEVRIGDARMLLEKELLAGEAGKYDVLAVDAFSDDSVPVHLLTVQALALYEKHLRGSGSIIAIHTSNRYLSLAPVVMRLAAARGLNAMIVDDTGDGDPSWSPSQWVIVTNDTEVFHATAFANVNSWIPEKQGPLWTDDYSSLLPILNVPL
ncbi:MAG: Integral membrane protein-like protein [Candidatus Kaiserbacteria bacterium GW2011_GWB1_52_6]|uniref:Integral membrane protein-like protein n=2 Tax=Candidatus Kaiseribacteriota TaxID=1752734 RepID=A0A0G1XBA7_9BACT|nr:MAG: Integral membrane protein-like protein [Candidatus Kaiserbacteria bacterium GW2011_GWA2_52_12]KKW28145.1 MAG: Integral membrane protein-like protein [Candidatus Kaiserbacteria bacterium GW2011_GWB1_52_6]